MIACGQLTSVQVVHLIRFAGVEGGRRGAHGVDARVDDFSACYCHVAYLPCGRNAGVAGIVEANFYFLARPWGEVDGARVVKLPSVAFGPYDAVERGMVVADNYLNA